MEAVFGLEPVVQFCELVFALVDDALFQAFRVCNHGGPDATRARLGRCLNRLQELDPGVRVLITSVVSCLLVCSE